MQIPKSTRYEIKMVTQSLMLPQVRSWLRVHPAGFNVLYPPREVNNIYFDTPDLASFEENLAGGSVRRKVRLRWYGKTPQNIKSVLEIKCKHNMHGWKMSQPLSKALDLPNVKWSKLIATIREQLMDELRIYLDSSGCPILINQYKREYYLSFDGIVRVTLDYSQKVYNQRNSPVPNLTFPLPPTDEMVVEVKADSEHHKRVAEVIQHLPLRVSRYSKYTLGVEGLLGY